MANKQRYSATHTPYFLDVVPEDQACVWVQDHVCWGPPGIDAGDG